MRAETWDSTCVFPVIMSVDTREPGGGDQSLGVVDVPITWTGFVTNTMRQILSILSDLRLPGVPIRVLQQSSASFFQHHSTFPAI